MLRLAGLNCDRGRQHDNTWRDHCLRTALYVFNRCVCFINACFSNNVNFALFSKWVCLLLADYPTFLCSDLSLVPWRVLLYVDLQLGKWFSNHHTSKTMVGKRAVSHHHQLISVLFFEADWPCHASQDGRAKRALSSYLGIAKMCLFVCVWPW